MAFFYTEDELSKWQNRAVNGPFKSANDAFENSPGDWDRIVSYAAQFPTSAGVMNFVGNTTSVDLPENIGVTDSYIFRWSSTANYYSHMICAAFVDLVNGTTVYRNDLKSVMLAQAQVAGVDFSNRSLYPTTGFDGNSDGVWTYALWVHKFLKCYDWIGKENFTAGEQTILEGWFADAAEWHEYLINTKSLDRLFVARGGDTSTYVPDYQFSYTDYPAFRGGPTRWNTGSWYTNRRWEQVYFVTNVGVLLNNTTYRNTGVNMFKEWLSFWFFPSGYWDEYHRSLATRPQAAIGYGTGNIAQAAGVAHSLYLNNYTNLYEYSTTTYLDPNDGQIKTGGVTRDLIWAVRNQELFLDYNSPDVYPYNYVGTDPAYLIHAARATAGTEQRRHRYKTGESASIVSAYYTNNQAIKNLYWGDGAGGFIGFPSDPTPQGVFPAYMGTGGVYPAYNFMYAGINDGNLPPEPPIVSEGTRSGRIQKTVRYIKH